jgi:hypothetical protein
MSFDALEWLAAMTSHVPNKGEQMVNSRVVRELRRKLYQRAKQENRKPLEEDDRKAVFRKTERRAWRGGDGDRARSHYASSLLY